MYCDFIVWLNEDIHIERIYPDDDFMANCIEKSEFFFRNAILPELIGKFYSRPPVIDSNTSLSGIESIDHDSPQVVNEDNSLDSSNANNQVYCYCKGPESGRMIGCDNSSCPYQWFHFICLQLSAPPKSKTWYCPDCRRLPSCRRKRKK